MIILGGNSIMNLGFLGNMSKPFHYFNYDDKLIIENMKALRDDSMIFFDLKNINKESLESDRAIDLRKGIHAPKSLMELDVLILLETSDIKNGLYQNDQLLRRIDNSSVFSINSIDSFFQMKDKLYLVNTECDSFPKSLLLKTSADYDFAWRLIIFKSLQETWGRRIFYAVIQRVDMIGDKVVEVTGECPGLFLDAYSDRDKIGSYFYEIVDKYVGAK